VFVGPDLSQNPEYLDCAANYTIYLVAAIRAIKKVRPVFRPLLVPRLPEIRRLRAMEKKAVDYHKPIVRARMAAAKNDPNWQQPDDMLQWLLKRGKEHGFTSVERLAKTQLGLIFAAIHTTSMTATNILYTLAVTPEYIEPLREEIRYVMSQNGGEITTRALQGMEKMDSYMKEVTRVYTPGISKSICLTPESTSCKPNNISSASFTRRVLKPITLSNAQHIPAGAMLEVPSAAVYSDATHYPDSASFDGFRHYKLRRSGTAVDHARNQFVTSNETNLGFGYGRHACPGRFFAANEIKMIVARLVMKYDIKMPGGRRERWENIEMGRGSVPDGGKAVLMRKAEG
jgi:cytochrome P450